MASAASCRFVTVVACMALWMLAKDATRAAAERPSQPNILFLLTDDQDLMLGGLIPMVNVKSLLTQQGMYFSNAFVHTPICCPSRSSYLTGKYLHNGGALNNSVAGNCNGQDWQDNNERATFAVHAQQAGYQVSYAGKYLNQYALPGSPDCVTKGEGGCLRVPPGYDKWLGLVGNSHYYNYDVIRSDDGTTGNAKLHKHGSDYAKDYFPDLVANRTLAVLDEWTAPPKEQRAPWIAVNAWPTPHGPFTPAPQFNRSFDGRTAPRTPNYNASEVYMQQKQWLMRQQAPITQAGAHGIDEVFEHRWEALLSVDDHVRRMVELLDDRGELDNTVIIFTSDHGFQLGQHRLPGDKRHLYEHDIRRIPANVTESAIVLNIDVAPTLVDIASSVNSTQPTDMDGMSFSRFLWPTVADGDDDLASWRTDFLISYHGQSGPCGLQNCPPPPPPHFHENDGRNNTYNCVRALSAEDNSQYCKFVDSENFIEHYDMVADPWQLHNKKGPDAAKEARLAAFRACSGSSCHSL